jgi:hypothetical protein
MGLDIDLMDVPVEEAELPLSDSVERELQKRIEPGRPVCILSLQPSRRVIMCFDI